MLPARLLARKESLYCDSLTSGPFCVLTNNSTKILTEGLIDRSLWGEVSAVTYYNLYSSLSDYAMDHWSGSSVRVPRATRLSSLVPSSPGQVGFRFEPYNVPVDFDSFSISSSSLYTLNSIYGFISFVYSSVSVTSFHIKAPSTTNVFVRAYQDGVPVWSRMVRAGKVLDVSQPSDREDPSVEAIDSLEVIGMGAEILSLSVSFVTTQQNSSTYLFVDRDLERPSRYAGIRSFPPSAHLIDMQTVMEQQWQWVQDPLPMLIAGEDEPEFASSQVLNKLHRVSSKYWDYFIMTFRNGGSVRFNELLAQSSPQLLAVILDTSSPDTNAEAASIEYPVFEAPQALSVSVESKEVSSDPKLEELRELLISLFHLEIGPDTPFQLQSVLLRGALESLLDDGTDVNDLLDLLIH